MRAVIQRVKKASVCVKESIHGQIDKGILVFVGFQTSDNEETMDYIIEKLIHLRIFEDEQGKMNLSVKDIAGGILAISNFTLYGDCRKGKRPSYTNASPVEHARTQYNLFIEKLGHAYEKIASGVFQADMQVDLSNDGPVTVLLDSDKLF